MNVAELISITLTHTNSHTHTHNYTQIHTHTHNNTQTRARTCTDSYDRFVIIFLNLTSNKMGDKDVARTQQYFVFNTKYNINSTRTRTYFI